MHADQASAFSFRLRDRRGHPRGGSTAVVAAVLVLGIPNWGFVEIVRFAHAKELASLTRFFEEERTEGVTLASRSPTVLTGGPERRFSPIEGLAGNRTSSYPRLGSRCKASKRKSGTHRSNHCWLSPCGRMPCFIRRAVKRGMLFVWVSNLSRILTADFPFVMNSNDRAILQVHGDRSSVQNSN